MSRAGAHVLITRPRTAGDRTAARLRAAGVTVTVAPMLRIEAVSGPKIATRGAQAVIATSANALRHGCPRLAARNLPVLTVGDATAEEARRLGFALVHSAGGNASDLLGLVRTTCAPQAGRLIYLAGRDRARDLQASLLRDGYDIELAEVYRAVQMRALPAEAAGLLKAGGCDAVLFYSARTATAFADAVRSAGLCANLSEAIGVCISPAAAAPLSELGWCDVVVAKRPDEAHLLDALADRLDLSGLELGESRGL